MEESKTMKTPMSSSIKLDKDEKGHSLVPWHRKRQNSVALSMMRLTTTRAQGKRLVEPSKGKHAERRALKTSYSMLWRSTSGTSNISLTSVWYSREISTSLNDSCLAGVCPVDWCSINCLLNCLSTWCGCLPMAIISSFQLRFAHRLKHWTPDFPSFEMLYSKVSCWRSDFMYLERVEIELDEDDILPDSRILLD
ncbi:hypothetical protein CK203_107090 [Vitis vinifera]|uniref:Uncharacterized protein n=1 Tax=Vitis vinifera TaxID=29760 RepID=A0A438E7I7_VITVI|nr:hypothetical protein CK203_107090 [Vitis vinifera]